MAELNKVRVQVLDPATGRVIESVDVKTSAGAVYLPDGTTLKDWIKNSEIVHSEFQKKLAEHLAKKHVDPEKVDSVLVGTEYDEATGKFTFTKHDGTTKVVDTLLEKLAINFDLVDGEGDEEGQKFLQITLDDGTVKKVNVTELVDVYTGSNGTNIVVTVGSNGEIGATLVDKSITMAQLSDEVTAAIAEQFVLEAATASKLGGVKIGAGIAVTADGTISTKNVLVDGVAKNIDFVTVADTVVIDVTGPADSLVTTTAGVAVAALTVNATASGDASAAASLEYQWYKKVVGTDVAFVAIEGATAATLPANKIDVASAGTTIYYCRVSATGDGVTADPVASKQVTVVVA